MNLVLEICFFVTFLTQNPPFHVTVVLDSRFFCKPYLALMFSVFETPLTQNPYFHMIRCSDFERSRKVQAPLSTTNV